MNIEEFILSIEKDIKSISHNITEDGKTYSIIYGKDFFSTLEWTKGYLINVIDNAHEDSVRYNIENTYKIKETNIVLVVSGYIELYEENTFYEIDIVRAKILDNKGKLIKEKELLNNKKTI